MLNCGVCTHNNYPTNYYVSEAMAYMKSKEELINFYGRHLCQNLFYLPSEKGSILTGKKSFSISAILQICALKMALKPLNHILPGC